MSALGPALREGGTAAPVPRSSELLLTIAAGQGGDRVTVGEIVDGLRDRAYGLVFVLLTLPSIIPAPPAVAAVLLALGILERDGLFILAGTIVAFATLAVIVLASVVYAVSFDRVVGLMLFG